MKKMGYRLELRRAYAGAENGLLRLKLLWCNTGVAPCYEPYPLIVKLKNDQAEKSWQLQEDIRSSIMPEFP